MINIYKIKKDKIDILKQWGLTISKNMEEALESLNYKREINKKHIEILHECIESELPLETIYSLKTR